MGKVQALRSAEIVFCPEIRTWLGYAPRIKTQVKSTHGSDLTPAQCRMGRAALQLGVRELAASAQVSTETVTRFEKGEALRPRTIAAIQSALEEAGVIFVPENGGGPGVRLKKQPAA